MTWRPLACVLLLLGTLAPGATLTLEQSPVYLGKTESVGVVFTVDEAPDSELRPLRVAVNVGSFSEVERISAGKYKSVYVPPATRFPQVALVAVWRETGAEAPIEFLKIPLYGSTRLPVGARSGAEVRVQVGGQEFGPHVVTRGTQVEVPIAVPPDVHEATINVKERGGSLATRKLPVDVPPYNRVTGALVPHAILADGQAEARLDVFYDLGGADVPASRLKVTASLGEVRFVRAQGGLYVYRYRAPAGASASQVNFSVSVEGDPAAKASVKLSLGQPPPARLVVRPPPRALPADGTSKGAVEVIVFDENGLGLPGQPLVLTANGTPLGQPTYGGDGLYRFGFVTPSEYPAGGLIQLQARIGAITSVANYQLIAPAVPSALTAHFSPNPVPADGRSTAEVRFEVRDAAGLALPGARLLVVASSGTLGPLTEESAGTYTATFSAPSGARDDVKLKVVDATGAFERQLELPLREPLQRLLIGVRGGYTHSLQELGGPRVGLDLSTPVKVGPTFLWLSVLATGGMSTQTIADASGTLTSQSTLFFVPLSARLAVELWASRRLSLLLGAGGGATWARASTTLTGRTTTTFGPNALGFAALHLAVGPGHFFLEAGYTWAPIQGDDFRAEAGGVGASAGYRLGIF